MRMDGKLALLVASFLPLIQFIVAQNLPLSSGVERTALLDLRSSLGLRRKDWPIKGKPCSNWTGVQCQNGRVIGINVSGLKRTRVGRMNPQFSVDSLVNLTLLGSFNASGFLLLGSMPDWFGRLNALQVLDLRSVSMSGSIPQSLGNLSRLNSLYLSDNNLIGSIPSSLGRLLDLSILDFSQNQLTGSVPPEFSLLGNIIQLDLSSNYLSGPIPAALGNLSSVQFLKLSDNSLSGSIPPQLGDLSQLVELDLCWNALSGLLPVELKGLSRLKKMVIKETELDGQLPVGLFPRLAHLEVLVLSSNRLSGAFLDELWSMPRLQILDVSSNNFTGELLNLSSASVTSGTMFNLSNNLFFGSLTSLNKNFTVLDLSNNYFQGELTNDNRINVTLDQNCFRNLTKQRNLDDCQLFYVQRGLSFNGAPETSPPSPPKSSKNLKYTVIGIFGGLGFLATLVCLLAVIMKPSHKGITSQIATANVGRIPRELFTYEQMLRSTDNFSEENLIKHGHSGDLFKGTLEGGNFVVIKRVKSGSLKKESYMMELDFFSKASHTRLVPLLGHCMENESEKLIVYKYMPNGDLADSMYRTSSDAEDDSLQTLDWITRLKIATGVAEGLSYLHHECSPPLIHRDIQASSILLDDKFEVRLGSLSEASVEEDAHQNVLTRLLRKPQTLDQGSSGPSSATREHDVYCFGKVLIELITGKVGISKSNDTYTRDWLEYQLSCISMHDKESMIKIVDPYLILDDDLLEEVWAMAIVAKSCLNSKPSRRPLMRHILKALENPLKLVREDTSSSEKLRTTSSKRSWSAAFFGSWPHSSSDSATVDHVNREGISGFRQSGRAGSHSSGIHDRSSSNKRSSEIFPEPVESQDREMQQDH